MYMVMFILDDPGKLDEVLDAWDRIGVSGVTIAETTGAYKRRAQFLGARFLFAAQATEMAARGNHTLFTVVPDEKAVHQCADAAEQIVGDLNAPHTGVLFAWPLSVVRGVPDRLREPAPPDRDKDEDR